MEKQEIIEFKPVSKRKPGTNKLRLATEIKFDKVKISLYHGADVELMNDI